MMLTSIGKVNILNNILKDLYEFFEGDEEIDKARENLGKVENVWRRNNDS